MENLKLAFKNAKKDKSYYKDVKMVLKDEDYYLGQIQDMLINKTYRTSEYKIFKVWDKTKEREIYKLPFYYDRIVHWALMQIIEPYLMNKLTINTFSAIPKRGIHFGLNRIKRELKDKDNTQYCLKMDIHHYYPSINHSILKGIYRKIFKDENLLWLIDEIIDSVEMSTGTGVPIGNYVSQWDGILYLNDFTHWLKETKHCKYVFVYMDDIVILSSSKIELHDLFNEINKYLTSNLKLEIKSNYQVFPVDVRGIDFLGYRIFRKYILLRKSTCKNFKRKMLNINKKLQKGFKITYSNNCTIQSYLGWLKWCNSYRLKQKYLGNILDKLEMK